MRGNFGRFAGVALLVIASWPGWASEVSGARPTRDMATHAPLPFLMVQHKRVLSYPFRQVWPTAIRYLRVDRGYNLRDRDEEAGFILFEFELPDSTKEAPRVGQGSLEMIRIEDAAGRPSVQIQVGTNSGPVHLPHAILEGIAAKVRAERGQPPPPPPRKPPKKEPDKEKPEDKPGQPPMMPPPDKPNGPRG